jgi:hypothetical protein
MKLNIAFMPGWHFFAFAAKKQKASSIDASARKALFQLELFGMSALIK